MTTEAAAERALKALDQLTASLIDHDDDDDLVSEEMQMLDDVSDEPSLNDTDRPSSAALDTIDFFPTSSTTDHSKLSIVNKSEGALEEQYHDILDKFLHDEGATASDTFLQLSTLLRNQHQHQQKLNRDNRMSSIDQEEADTWMLLYYLASEDGDDGVFDMLFNSNESDGDTTMDSLVPAPIALVPMSISGMSPAEFVDQTLRGHPALSRLCILRKWLEYCHSKHHAKYLSTRPLRASKVLNLPDTPMNQQGDIEAYLNSLFHAILSNNWEMVRSICERHGELWRWVTLSGGFPLDYIRVTTEKDTATAWSIGGNHNVSLWRNQCRALATKYRSYNGQGANPVFKLEAALYNTLARTYSEDAKTDISETNPFLVRLSPYERQHVDWLLKVRGTVDGIVDDVLEHYKSSTKISSYDTSISEKVESNIGVHLQLQRAIVRGISIQGIRDVIVDSSPNTVRLMTHLVIFLKRMTPSSEFNTMMELFVIKYIDRLSDMNVALVPLYVSCLSKELSLKRLAELFHNINEVTSRNVVVKCALKYFSSEEVWDAIQNVFNLSLNNTEINDETIVVDGNHVYKHCVLQMHRLNYVALFRNTTGRSLPSSVVHTSNLLKRFVIGFADGDIKMLNAAQVLLQRFDPDEDDINTDDSTVLSALHDKRALALYLTSISSCMKVKHELVPSLTSSHIKTSTAALELYVRKIRSMATRTITDVENCANELEEVLESSFEDLLFQNNSDCYEIQKKLRAFCLPHALDILQHLLRSSATYLEKLCNQLEHATVSISSSQAQDVKKSLRTTIYEWLTRVVHAVSEFWSRDELLSIVDAKTYEDVLQNAADDFVKIMQYEECMNFTGL